MPEYDALIHEQDEHLVTLTSKGAFKRGERPEWPNHGL